MQFYSFFLKTTENLFINLPHCPNSYDSHIALSFRTTLMKE